MMSDDYDSTADTLRHSRRVDELLAHLAKDILGRIGRHDSSKLHPPEKETFDQAGGFAKYGSVEYQATRDRMEPALRHHYKYNRHHPEHTTAGIRGMTLTDLCEMLADWKASGERHDVSTDLATSLPLQRERFKLSADLFAVLVNTAEELGWMRHDTPTGMPIDLEGRADEVHAE